MSEREARNKLISIARERLPSTVINLSTAVLIWLFGVLVFLPAAYRIAPRELPLACGLILLVGFSIFVFKAFGGLRLLLESTPDVLAYEYIRRRKTKIPVERLRTIVKCIIYVVAALILYALYSPFLAAIYPSLSGLVLITIVLWIFWMLFQTVNACLT
ncbi:MAG: hypothetical protein OEZ35_00285 [Candidatus Bathyarchaeota archaeon]|nr:hypothetical protein [Candidatus Bathyarchaeota archaeon]MDH5782094.1 hypothetical protein [Candidatus Bathyarchaeota archaeon]